MMRNERFKHLLLLDLYKFNNRASLKERHEKGEAASHEWSV
jgi:hypothetical protein